MQPPEINLQSPILPPQQEENVTVVSNPTPPAARGEEVTIRGQQQEKDRDLYKVRGAAQVNFRTHTLRADELTYDSATGQATATGHVVFDGGPHDEHIEASHGTYNIRTEEGTFYDVTGTVGARFRGGHSILTTSNPFAFTGKVVERQGPDHYVIRNGTVTSCELPHPKWTFNAHRVTVNVGGTAKIYNSTFRVLGVPVFYLPFADHPVKHLGRQSGFLMPAIGQSSRKGTMLGDSFYWAINRSMDATLGAELYSARGWSQHGEFRAVPNDHSYVSARYFGVVDRGYGPQKIKQGGEEVRFNGVTTFGKTRAVANVDYLSSFIFRLAFNQVFTQAVYSEVISNAFLSRNSGPYSLNANTERYQDFLTATPGQVITVLHVPSFEFSSVDQRIPRSPLYWSFDSEAGGLSRSEPGFRTASVVGRFDVAPVLSLPLLFHGWMLRPELSVRETGYTQSLLAPTTLAPGEPASIGSAQNDPINRRAAEGGFELRPPALAKIFQRPLFARQFKHEFEPAFVYQYVTGVDNFSQILRFDERDVLSNTNEIEYSIVNRVFSKRLAPAECKEKEKCDRAASPPGEIITWRVGQKYFFDPRFGGAVIPGRSNVFATTTDFTGLAFLTEPRHVSPVISRLHMQANGHADMVWDMDYDTKKGRLNSSTSLFNFRFGQASLGGGHFFLRIPGELLPKTTIPVPPFSQYRVMGSWGNPNRRGFNFASAVGVDARLNVIQYSAVQTTYNWDCCGVTFEYRRFALGPVRNENQFRFAFSLANIGTFGNLRRQERLF